MRRIVAACLCIVACQGGEAADASECVEVAPACVDACDTAVPIAPTCTVGGDWRCLDSVPASVCAVECVGAPMSCVADLSPDPGQEILAGPTLYRLPAALPACATPPCIGALKWI